MNNARTNSKHVRLLAKVWRTDSGNGYGTLQSMKRLEKRVAGDLASMYASLVERSACSVNSYRHKV